MSVTCRIPIAVFSVGMRPFGVRSLGTDAAGEVYVLTIGGPIRRLVEVEDGSGLPVTIVPVETIAPPGAGNS